MNTESIKQLTENVQHTAKAIIRGIRDFKHDFQKKTKTNKINEPQ